MKKIILGLVAAFALVSFAAPVHAQDAAGGDTKTDAKKDKKAKKGKKGDKGDAAGGDAAGGDAAKK